MENVLFWAKNDAEAEQIAINDFVTKAHLVLRTYENILGTWIRHTPHTCFYSHYNSMFTEDDSHWINRSVEWRKTITDYIDPLYEKVRYFVQSKEALRKMMGGGEVPFIFLEKMAGGPKDEDFRYQYHVGR